MYEQIAFLAALMKIHVAFEYTCIQVAIVYGFCLAVMQHGATVNARIFPQAAKLLRVPF